MGGCQLSVSKNVERDMAGFDQQPNPMTLTRAGSTGSQLKAIMVWMKKGPLICRHLFFSSWEIDL